MSSPEFCDLALTQLLLDLLLDLGQRRRLRLARVVEANDVEAELRLDRCLGHFALLQLDHRLGELGHEGHGVREIEVAAVGAQAGVLQFFCASSSNLAPPLICAISAFAWSSVSTRM